MNCARCRNSTTEGKFVLCPQCYEEFAAIAGNPNDIAAYRAVRDLLAIRDDMVIRDVSDSAGGTELLTDMLDLKDHDTLWRMMLQVGKRRS